MHRAEKLMILAGSLISVAVATFMIFFTLNESLLRFMTDVFFGSIGNKMVTVALSLVVIIIAIKIVLDTTQKVTPYMAVASVNDGLGQVNINISALEKTALMLAEEAEGIDDARVFVEPRKKGVKIIVEIETPTGANIQMATRNLQTRIKERFEKGIGVSVIEIQILVKSLGIVDTANLYRERINN